jgi:hypothetical protein
MFDAIGVPRPLAMVVAAGPSSIDRAVATVDRGDGTVWSADARAGFNGGGEYVRWVRDEADRRDALELLVPKCDRVRVAAFAEGVPCSIHGFVVDDGVAVFRPVELVTLRAPAAPRRAGSVSICARRSASGARSPSTGSRHPTVGSRRSATRGSAPASPAWTRHSPTCASCGFTPHGPSIAPLAVAGFAWADEDLGLGLGSLAAARSA